MLSRAAFGGAAALGAALALLRHSDVEADTVMHANGDTCTRASDAPPNAPSSLSTSSPPSPPDADYPPHSLSPDARGLPPWVHSGCGDGHFHCPERGAVFPAHDCPDDMPDLSRHTNFCAEFLREHPEVYHKYKHTRTSTGVPFAACIKTGMDTPGHPMIKTVGLVAGDASCLHTFPDLFEPVTAARHGGWHRGAVHPTDMCAENISRTRIDPSCDADGNCDFVLTARIRTGRSLRGLRLPPVCSFEERREVERAAVAALRRLTGELEGDYHPLPGSRSYPPKPWGMGKEKAAALRAAGNVFQDVDSTRVLSSGTARHWPDARGIFHNHARDVYVWVNEEDHLRIIAVRKGDDVGALFERFAHATDALQDALREEGYEFLRDPHYGWVLSCPSNMGTGLRAGALIRLPLLSARPDFQAFLGRMRLQARGSHGVDSPAEDGVYDISNADRMGKSETQLVNVFVEGAAQLVRWEKMLQAGMPVDHLLPQCPLNTAAAATALGSAGGQQA